MAKRVGLLTGIAVVAFFTLGIAHEGKTHLMGTVTSLDAQHVGIQDQEGKTISVLVSSSCE